MILAALIATAAIVPQVAALAWYWLRKRRVAARKAARLRARLFEVGMEIERDRDAALAGIARDVRAVHIAAGGPTMSDFDHGPLRTYEVTWRSGHIETVQGHQVSTTSALNMFAHPGEPRRPVRFAIHGDFPRGGTYDWRLVLTGLEEDIITIRDVTTPEQIAAQERTAGGES